MNSERYTSSNNLLESTENKSHNIWIRKTILEKNKTFIYN